MLDEWSKAAGIAAEFHLSGQDMVLPPEYSRQVRHIVSEALNNVRHHASASRVRIALNMNPEELDIEIGDDGRGIERKTDDLPAFVAEGKLGIAGMKERVELLGGYFYIDSPGDGTRITIRVPISP
jgi:two-component system sensor histidine kinase DegS